MPKDFWLSCGFAVQTVRHVLHVPVKPYRGDVRNSTWLIRQRRHVFLSANAI